MKPGTVALVGAGPDPGLLTVKGAQLLSEADIVLTDRLVTKQVLEHVVRPRLRRPMSERVTAPVDVLG
jgi:siroheme synthase